MEMEDTGGRAGIRLLVVVVSCLIGVSAGLWGVRTEGWSSTSVHCGCPSKRACSMPCSSCCIPVCTLTDPTGR